MRSLLFALPVAAVVLVIATSCSDDLPNVPLSCFDAGVDPASCTAAYVPTYDNLLASTFRPRCAMPACHGGADAKGGLSFDDAELAYAKLLRDGVTKGEPGCSDLVLRVTDTTGPYRMPPAAPLDAGEQCALAQWVANGAVR